MKIALAGNPNSGKTTMYNALTGKNEKVGNWAGVTVDKRESRVKKEYDPKQEVILVDLPGAYSMSPFTNEETITSEYITNEHPEVIINIVDATNLSRSLFFTTQIIELGIPVVVALNKNDINEKKKTEINVDELSAQLGCPIVKTSAISSDGLKNVISKAIEVSSTSQQIIYKQKEIDLSNKDEVVEEDVRRYAHVNEIVKKVEKRVILTKDLNKDDKIDDILTHPVFGLIIFGLIMFGVFYISQTTVGTWIADWLTGYIDMFQEWVASLMVNTNPFIQALVVDGMIGGTSAVVGFLPLVMVMYFLIALLEDCGYMSRATVVLDPIFKRVGLSGKSVIPMVIGVGCGVPAIMACRTIKNERERRATAMLATFMPCGAKLPVIALFAGAFFPKSTWIGPLMYFVGIFCILFGALIVKGVTGAKFKKSLFIIELPEYKVPSLKLAFESMIQRGKAYIIKAGTIILVCNTVIQIMQSFNWQFEVVEEGLESTSILASIAGPFAYILVPIVGVCAWQLAAAAITGFIAKENVVGTLATCYALTSFIDTEELALVGNGNAVAVAMGITKVAALAYLMFNLFTPPCFAAIGAMRSEMQSTKWTFAAIVLQLSTGYTIGFLVYQVGTLVTTGSVGAGFVSGLVVVAVIVSIVAYLYHKGNKQAAL